MKTLITAAIIALAPVTASAGDLYYSVSAYGLQGESLHKSTNDCLYTMGMMQSNFKRNVGKTKTIKSNLGGKDYVQKVVASKDGIYRLSMTCYF
jgi:hypothetical protein